MLWVEFEPTIPAFERAKTVHAFDSATTVIDNDIYVINLITVFENNPKIPRKAELKPI
jgi:hypothetical protein